MVRIHPAARPTCHTAEAAIFSTRIPPCNDFPAPGFRLSLEHRAADFADGDGVEVVLNFLKTPMRLLDWCQQAGALYRKSKRKGVILQLASDCLTAVLEILFKHRFKLRRKGDIFEKERDFEVQPE